jgi:hypothetical protein
VRCIHVVTAGGKVRSGEACSGGETFGEGELLGDGGGGERAHHGLDGGETIGGELAHGVAGEFAGAGRGELGALQVGEQELSDGRCGHGDGDIGEALGGGGRRRRDG